MRSLPATKGPWLGPSIVLAASLVGCDPAGPPAHEARVLAYAHSGVPWMFDDDGYQYLIDTGTPRSFVIPPVARRGDDVFLTEVVEGWDVNGLGADVEVVVTYELPPAILPMMDSTFGGIMAADVLSRQPFMLDPLRSRFVLDDDGRFDEWLSETDDAVRVPVTIAGGGTTCMQVDRCFEHDGHRVLVDVLVDGEPVVALLDTASTYTTMGRGLLERLGQAEGRPHVVVSRFWDSWDFVRLEELAVGGARLADVPVRVNPALDTAFARLSVETGEKVELLLGHSFLLYFMTGVDYDGPSLTLARYSAPRTIETEMFESFGIWLVGSNEERGSCLPVVALAQGGEADRAGIDLGDCVIELDGRDGATLTDADVDLVLRQPALGEALSMVVLDTPAEGGRQTAPRPVTLTKASLLPAR